MITCSFENGKKANLRHVVIDAILIKKDQILLIKRAKNLVEGDKWALSGGFLERDEDLSQALLREILEETGYEIKKSRLFTILDFPRRNDERQNVTFIYVCEAGEKVGEADDESSEQKWFDFDSLPSEKDMAFDHYKIIQHKYL